MCITMVCFWISTYHISLAYLSIQMVYFCLPSASANDEQTVSLKSKSILIIQTSDVKPFTNKTTISLKRVTHNLTHSESITPSTKYVHTQVAISTIIQNITNELLTTVNDIQSLSNSTITETPIINTSKILLDLNNSTSVTPLVPTNVSERIPDISPGSSAPTLTPDATNNSFETDTSVISQKTQEIPNDVTGSVRSTTTTQAKFMTSTAAPSVSTRTVTNTMTTQTKFMTSTAVPIVSTRTVTNTMTTQAKFMTSTAVSIVSTRTVANPMTTRTKFMSSTAVPSVSTRTVANPMTTRTKFMTSTAAPSVSTRTATNPMATQTKFMSSTAVPIVSSRTATNPMATQTKIMSSTAIPRVSTRTVRNTTMARSTTFNTKLGSKKTRITDSVCATGRNDIPIAKDQSLEWTAIGVVAGMVVTCLAIGGICLVYRLRIRKLKRNPSSRRTHLYGTRLNSQVYEEIIADRRHTHAGRDNSPCAYISLTSEGLNYNIRCNSTEENIDNDAYEHIPLIDNISRYEESPYNDHNISSSTCDTCVEPRGRVVSQSDGGYITPL